MEQFNREETKLSFIILLLIGLFILNACGASNSGVHTIPTNLDNRDAVTFQTGIYRGGTYNENLVPSFEGDKVVYKESANKVFSPVDLIVDFDKKHVSFDTDVNIDGRIQSIKLEGDFKDGIAVVTARDPKDNKPIGVGSIRCDGLCKVFSAEVFVKKIDQNGVVSYPETHFQFDAEKVDVRGKPDATPSALPTLPSNTQPVPSATLRTPIKKKASFNGVTAGVSTTAPGPKNEDDKNKSSTTQTPQEVPHPLENMSESSPLEGAIFQHPTAISEEQKSDLKAILNLSGKPEVKPVAATPVRTPPPTSPVPNPQNNSSQPPKVDSYGIDLNILPYDLGPQYTGQAQGCYSAECGQNLSYLSKATPIAATRAANPAKASDGLVSYDLGARYTYGTGLTVRHLQLAGEEFAKKYPNDTFMSLDASKQGGGDQRCGTTLAEEKKWKSVKGHTCRHESHRNGLDVDLEFPRLKNHGIDYQKFAELIKILASFNTVDRFGLDTSHIKKLCPYFKTPEEKKVFNMIYYWPDHVDHVHMREKCTPHNQSCFPTAYPDNNGNGVRC